MGLLFSCCSICPLTGARAKTIERRCRRPTHTMCFWWGKWQHALCTPIEPVHTHQHICRAVNRMQDRERGTHGASTLVSFPLTAAVNILYCRKNLCVSYMLPLPDLITFYPQRKDVLIVSIWRCVAGSYVYMWMWWQMQHGEPDVPLPRRRFCFWTWEESWMSNSCYGGWWVTDVFCSVLLS